MAFKAQGAYIDRGQFNSDKNETQLGEHSYLTLDDTLAQVSSFSPFYFPNYLGDTAEDVLDGDLLLVSASDGFARYKIVQNADPFTIIAQEDVNPDPDFNNITTNTITFAQTSTPPGPSQLSFYAENVVIPLTFSGAFSVPIDTQAIITRIGTFVSITVKNFTGISDVGGPLAATIPSWIQLSPSAVASGRQHVDGLVSNSIPFIGAAIIAPESNFLEIVKLDGTINGHFLDDGLNVKVSDFTICYCIN